MPFTTGPRVFTIGHRNIEAGKYHRVGHYLYSVVDAVSTIGDDVLFIVNVQTPDYLTTQQFMLSDELVKILDRGA